MKSTKPKLPFGFKYTHAYRLRPSEETVDEYPDLGRYGETVVKIKGYSPERGLLVSTSNAEAFVSRDELVEDLGLDRLITKRQAAILRTCLYGEGRYKQMKTAYEVVAGCRVDHMGFSTAIFSLLDRIDTPSPPPRRQLGYLSRVKNNGTWLYKTTQLGVAALRDYEQECSS